MASINFKATRRIVLGYRELEKSGDIEYDAEGTSLDVLTVYPKPNTRVIVHCLPSGQYQIVFIPQEDK